MTTVDGETGTAQGSLLETENTSSVLVTVNLAGSGAIYGTVYDEAGLPVPSALVTAINNDTGESGSATGVLSSFASQITRNV